jgi:hypothetical protein
MPIYAERVPLRRMAYKIKAIPSLYIFNAENNAAVLFLLHLLHFPSIINRAQIKLDNKALIF